MKASAGRQHDIGNGRRWKIIGNAGSLYAFSIRHRLVDPDKLMPLDGIVAQGGIECGVCFDGECRIDTTHVIHLSWSLIDCDRCPNHWNAS